MTTTKCEVVVSTLTHRYYLSFGATRSKSEWKTFKGALRAAAARGCEVLTKQDPMIKFRQDDKRTKIVTNLMTKKLVRIPVNTPACCDPSTETYWSM